MKVKRTEEKLKQTRNKRKGQEKGEPEAPFKRAYCSSKLSRA
jgi:hypothetical protein